MELSVFQQQSFVGWKRPREIFENRSLREGIEGGISQPTMLTTNPIDLVQDVTTDCSVVASLCAAAARAETGFENVRI
jgi:calpain-7